MNRWLISGLFFFALACESDAPAPAPTPSAQVVAPAEVPPLRDLTASATGRTLTNLQAGIDIHTAQATEREDNWLSLKLLAKTYMARQRLNADWQDFQRAEDALEDAFKRAPEGSGPFLTRADLNFTLHRFDRIEDDLLRVEMMVLQDDSQRANVAGIRGDIALQSGRLDEAQEHFLQGIAISSTAKSLARLAALHRSRGEHELAGQKLDEALGKARVNGPYTQAWVELQRGILDLDRGRLDDAMTHFQAADTYFDGWYLIDEHIAEVHTLKGEDAKAEALYVDIIARTQSGEFMDALAEIKLRAGQADEANKLTKAATEAFEKQIKMFPEAAYGHAIHHFLNVDAERALELAGHNHTLRPGHEAKTLLAAAFLGVGKVDEASQLIQEIEKSAWSTPEYHSVAHCVHQKSGDKAGMARHAEAANKISKDALKEFDCK